MIADLSTTTQLEAPLDCIPDVHSFPTRMQLNTVGHRR